MVLRDIYNVVGEATQETFFSEDYSTYEVINANTEAHYRYSGHDDDICLGGDSSEIFRQRVGSRSARSRYHCVESSRDYLGGWLNHPLVVVWSDYYTLLTLSI